VGKLDADRVCQRCLHQLQGTVVYRETRLDIRYVRCNECGIHMPVTEFPHSWKWLRRTALFLTIGIALVALALLAADVAAVATSSYQIAWDVIRPIGQAFSGANVPMGSDPAVFDRIASTPLVQSRVRESALVMLIPLSIIGTVGGFLWSAVLLHRRLKWVLLIQLLPLGLAIAFSVMAWFIERPMSWTSWSYMDVAMARFGLPYIFMMFGWTCACRALAVVVARPIIRGVLWVIVPRRIRDAVASVWTDELARG
jgi:hypothetical protein